MAKDRKSAPRRKKAPAKKRPPVKRESKATRPPGRPHRCVPGVIDDVCTALGLSASNKDAANYAGISGDALQIYFRRGREALEAIGLDPDEPPDQAWEHADLHDSERPFVQMLTRAIRARARGNVGLLATVHKAAKGGAVFEDRVDPETGKVARVQVGFVAPDWRAAAKLLAVRQPRDYAEKRQVTIGGETGAPIGVQTFLPVLEGDEPPEGEG